MNTIKSYNNIENIPSLEYEGYVWMSDKENPIVLKNEFIDFSSYGVNPFIIEALLYNKEKSISIHVQHTGDYKIYEYHLDEIKSEYSIEKSYLAHRIDGVKKLKFRQLWNSEPDELCEGMDVLTLKSFVFCGFVKQ